MKFIRPHIAKSILSVITNKSQKNIKTYNKKIKFMGCDADFDMHCCFHPFRLVFLFQNWRIFDVKFPVSLGYRKGRIRHHLDSFGVIETYFKGYQLYTYLVSLRYFKDHKGIIRVH